MVFLCSTQVVINTEWGALGNTGSLDFIRTKFDHLVDDFSKNPGHQASYCSAQQPRPDCDNRQKIIVTII
jgi:hypothetical protein